MNSGKGAKLTDAQVAEAARKVRPKLRAALVLAIVGGILMGTSIKDVANGHFTDTWLTTEGKIIASSIVRVRRMQFPQSLVAHPDFIYSFVAQGQLVESKDESFDKTDDKSVSELVAKYPEGKAVTVHYLKDNPNISYFDYDGATAHSPRKPICFVLGFLILLTAMQMMFKLRKVARGE